MCLVVNKALLLPPTWVQADLRSGCRTAPGRNIRKIKNVDSVDLLKKYRGPGETAHRGPASGTRRDVRARPTQGRVAPAKGNAKHPERPRDEGGPTEARPASLHRLVGQVPGQRQGRRPKDSTDIGTKGRAEDTFKSINMRIPICDIQWTLVSPALVSPVVTLTQSKTYGTNHSG
jgi:hypothetical protein